MFNNLRDRWEILVLLLILCISIPLIICLPDKMVQQVYHGDRQRSIESGNNYARLVDDYRKTIVQVIGGAFLLYTIYLTLRRTKATEATLRTTQASLEVTRETQITDRFTKAITQLGATDNQGNKQLEIRFGGIYALERVARDSPADHWPIMEILTAYVRQNANSQEVIEENGHVSFKPDKDIEAVMTVIGRSHRRFDKGILELSNVDIRGVRLDRARLARADFLEAKLSGCSFHKADLKRADFWKASLEHAYFNGSNLKNAMFIAADLRSVDFQEAHLEGADFRGACLADAYFKKAHLDGAELRETKITQLQIEDAFGDYTTKLPANLKYPDHWSTN